ncbi:MAG TPA: carboxypeptidase-like regulatory domain-containing protein, partial [Thermoplasmata archaeon]|nr:carboxypeptidase-like regulatory domain-containing protein [Thermoplasmata archaeon]
TCTGGPTTGNIKGKVTDQTTSAAISGAKVDAILGGVTKGTANTIADGTYTISTLDPGTYIVQVSAPTYQMKNVTGVVVTAGQDTTSDVQLTKPTQPGKGGVKGIVKETVSGTAVDAATVKLLQGTTEVMKTATASDGSYSFTNVEPGSYTVEASKTDYDTATKAVTVKANEDATVDISIKKKETTPPPPENKGIFGMGPMADYGIIGAIIAIVIVALLAMMLMKKKKGADAYQQGVPPPGPPQQQWGPPQQQGYGQDQQWQQPPQGGQGGGY